MITAEEVDGSIDRQAPVLRHEIKFQRLRRLDGLVEILGVRPNNRVAGRYRRLSDQCSPKIVVTVRLSLDGVVRALGENVGEIGNGRGGVGGFFRRLLIDNLRQVPEPVGKLRQARLVEPERDELANDYVDDEILVSLFLVDR